MVATVSLVREVGIKAEVGAERAKEFDKEVDADGCRNRGGN